MRGAGSIVWALLFGGILLGFLVLAGARSYYGPGSGPAEGLEAFKGVREVDEKTKSRLSDLGLKFASLTGDGRPKEPTLDLVNPTDADFRFLEQILASNDNGARVSAARVLRDIGAPRSVEPLVGAIRGIEDMDRFMLEAALTIVNRLTQEQRLAALVPAWEMHRTELPEFAIEPLRLKLRDIGAFDPEWLRAAAISHPDVRVRRFAVREIAAGPNPPAGILAAALGDSDPDVRATAQKALDAKPH